MGTYKDNQMYKAFLLKVNSLVRELGGKHDHTISKLQMFAQDAFDEQQAVIDALERDKQELISLIMNSDAKVHYMTLHVAKSVAKSKRK